MLFVHCIFFLLYINLENYLYTYLFITHLLIYLKVLFDFIFIVHLVMLHIIGMIEDISHYAKMQNSDAHCWHQGVFTEQ